MQYTSTYDARRTATGSTRSLQETRRRSTTLDRCSTNLRETARRDVTEEVVMPTYVERHEFERRGEHALTLSGREAAGNQSQHLRSRSAYIVLHWREERNVTEAAVRTEAMHEHSYTDGE